VAGGSTKGRTDTYVAVVSHGDGRRHQLVGSKQEVEEQAALKQKEWKKETPKADVEVLIQKR